MYREKCFRGGGKCINLSARDERAKERESERVRDGIKYSMREREKLDRTKPKRGSRGDKT